MSELRIIPADQAKAMREAATDRPWAVDPDGDVVKSHDYDPEMDEDVCSPEHRKDAALIAVAPDLAYTVEQQAAQIARLQEVVQSNPEWREYITNGWITEEDMQ